MGRSLPILGVPGVLGEHKRTLIITDFTQSLGPELLTNGDFSAWTGDNPDGWTVLNETAPDPEVTERDPNQGHADTKTVGGAANLYNSALAYKPEIRQSKATVGNWHEYEVALTNVTSGQCAINVLGWVWFNTATTIRLVYRALYTGLFITAPVAGSDVTVDNVSLKRITLNAQQTMPANAIVDFTYALPASPAAGDTISVFYRISDASLEAGYNCWRAYLRRNVTNSAWDFRLDSVNAGTATNRINVTGVGDTVGIRVQCNGTLHDCWTTANGTDWTARGSQVNVSWNNAATGINTIYCTGTTPTKLTATPL